MIRRILPLLALLLVGSWAAPAGAEPFTEKQLQQLLQKNPETGRPVDSVGELIPLLPNELRENFLFVYESRSPFHAGISPEYPRVILFTNDARLVLTFIGDERQPPPHQRQDRRLAEQVAIALVVGMEGDGRVAEHGLGAGGGDDHPGVRVALGGALQRVGDLVELACDRLHLDLEVGDGGAEDGRPVDQVVAAVDQPFLDLFAG